VIRATLDSNIYISGLVFIGKPRRLLDMAAEGEFEAAISDSIIAEVQRVLELKFGWSETRAVEAIATMAEFTKHVAPTESIDAVPSDPDDNRILECAVAADSEVIVTGDLDLLRLGSFRGIAIESATDFLARFEVGPAR
jgi:putative PIN family toxin of toxin-antitoxin system